MGSEKTFWQTQSQSAWANNYKHIFTLILIPVFLKLFEGKSILKSICYLFPFLLIIILVFYTLSISTVYMYACYVLHQSINQTFVWFYVCTVWSRTVEVISLIRYRLFNKVEKSNQVT